MDPMLTLIGRTEPLFSHDIEVHEKDLSRIVASSRFLLETGTFLDGRM